MSENDEFQFSDSSDIDDSEMKEFDQNLLSLRKQFIGIY